MPRQWSVDEFLKMFFKRAWHGLADCDALRLQYIVVHIHIPSIYLSFYSTMRFAIQYPIPLEFA